MRRMPHTIAELGPGNSLGIGLAAMLCGAKQYIALDVVKYSDIDTNLAVLDELIELFESRAARPTKGWPDFDRFLDDNLFPSHILSDELLRSSLSKDRISAIRNELENQAHDNSDAIIKYMVPWLDDSVIEKDSVDVILSQSVLEHVVDLDGTYNAIHSWLKPNGIMSHQIDFTSHGISESWNGYRVFPESLWKAITGSRPYLINRQPHSVHVNHIVKNHFNIICDYARNETDGIARSDLSGYWESISDGDLSCSGAFIQASKI